MSKKNSVIRIGARDRNDIIRLLSELQNSELDFKTLAEKRHFNWNTLKEQISKDSELRKAYNDSLEIQSTLNTNKLLNTALQTMSDMVEGKTKETKTNYTIDENGNKVISNISETIKAPDFRSVEKVLKTFANEKFGDKLGPEKLTSIFMAFNRYIVDTWGRADLVDELFDIEKAFIDKISSE